MVRSATRPYVISCLMVASVVGLTMPTQAEYTKLYRFHNETGTPMGGVRVLNNAVEIITDYCVVPSTWRTPPSSPNIGELLISGVFSTKIRWEGDPVEVGDVVKVGWTTADNNCRLRDMRWVGTDGVLGDPVVDPNQRGGIPGGGQVTYDPEAGGYVWTITNDTGFPINLSDCELTILDERPTFDELLEELWPGEAILAQEAGAMPHPDLVALRVDRIKTVLLQPLMAAIEAERGQPYLLGHDCEALLVPLTDAANHLAAGRDVYERDNPAPALDAWAAAVGDLTAFDALVDEFAARTDYDQSRAYRIGPYIQRPVSPVWASISLNDSGVIASSDNYSSSDWRAYVWDTTRGDAGFQSLHQDDWSVSFVGDIDAQGRVAGSVIPHGGFYEPCVWEPEPATGQYVFRDLLSGSGWDWGYVYGMNDVGQAVGAGALGGVGYTLLLDLATGMHPGGQWGSGADINNHREIVELGYAVYSSR